VKEKKSKNVAVKLPLEKATLLQPTWAAFNITQRLYSNPLFFLSSSSNTQNHQETLNHCRSSSCSLLGLLYTFPFFNRKAKDEFPKPEEDYIYLGLLVLVGYFK